MSEVKHTPERPETRTFYVVQDRRRSVAEIIEDITSGTLPPHLKYADRDSAERDSFPTEKTYLVVVTVAEAFPAISKAEGGRS